MDEKLFDKNFYIRVAKCSALDAFYDQQAYVLGVLIHTRSLEPSDPKRLTNIQNNRSLRDRAARFCSFHLCKPVLRRDDDILPQRADDALCPRRLPQERERVYRREMGHLQPATHTDRDRPT